MTIRERIRSLTAQAKELEPQAAEEEQRNAYVSALRAERRSVEHNLTVALNPRRQTRTYPRSVLARWLQRG
ncbi:MAG: hypothetical protein H0W90_11540 [Actinobacteria bacterium]|nr:hypothetical protein [Actinomycetota bacterium]